MFLVFLGLFFLGGGLFVVFVVVLGVLFLNTVELDVPKKWVF